MQALAIPNGNAGNAIGNSNGHRVCHLKKDVVLKELECYEETRLFEDIGPENKSKNYKKDQEKRKTIDDGVQIDEKEIAKDLLTRIWNFEEAREKGAKDASNFNKILNGTSFVVDEGLPIDFDFLEKIIDKNQKDNPFTSRENVKENLAKLDVTSFVLRENSSFHKTF